MSGVAARHLAALVRPLTADAYDLLVGAGVYEGQPVELLEGQVVDVAPQGPQHGDWLSRITAELQIRLYAAHGRRYLVKPQVPLRASDISQPEPDVYIVDWDTSTPDRHPTTAHLAVEVAVTSHDLDLGDKPRIYAGADIDRYWVVDALRREVVVHTEPYAAGQSQPAGYGAVRRLPLDTELEALGISLNLAEVLR